MAKIYTLPEKNLTFFYVLTDAIAMLLAWICFFSYRKFTELHIPDSEILEFIVQDWKFYIGSFMVTACWLIFYTFSGLYRQVWKKSRIKEVSDTFIYVLLGSVVLFFAVILDDNIILYTDYFRLFFALFLLNFIWAIAGRLLFLTCIRRQILKFKIKFNTVIIGTIDSISTLYPVLSDKRYLFGNDFIGYISAVQNEQNLSENSTLKLPCLGDYTQIENIVNDNKIKEIILSNDAPTRELLAQILPVLIQKRVLLKVLPNTGEHLLSMVKTTSIFHQPVMEIHLALMTPGQKFLKRSLDIAISLIFILLLSPLYLFLAIGVKLSSRGSVFFRQQRVGKNGKLFKIIKFRSMYLDAEADGTPRLSSVGDKRITPFGLFMRRTHLDEIPQFFNVLAGNMSLVGPRPERQFFIDQIVQKTPYYKLLLLVKPGITSWGQVTYGYAENVEQMLERLNYDLMYIENLSILMDIKILFYTLLAILKRNGK
ncbi:MAG: sugar transferase [Bacteroidales bacterium]|jgi:exopolysaccharide biosynthesis polyprenyl glycosylphosphotransferase|nr:sugar transferase [Bacteroidales bacterium]